MCTTCALRAGRVRTKRAAAFLAKAQRQLEWIKSWLAELREHGGHARMGEVERVLFASLAAVASTHEALLSAASCLKKPAWRDELQSLRLTDPLLYFVWMARDAEIHNAVLKWEHVGRSAQVVVEDAKKFNAFVGLFRHPLFPAQEMGVLFHWLFDVRSGPELVERLKRDPRPIEHRMTQVGVKLDFAIHGLVFSNFVVRKESTDYHVNAPTHHLGKELAPTADFALEKVIEFYRTKLGDLQRALDIDGDKSSGAH